MSVYATPPESTALLVIDAQEEYFSEAGALFTPNAEGIRTNLLDLVDAAEKAGVLCVLVRHVHRASGVDVGRMGDFDDESSFVEGTPTVELITELRDRPGAVIVDKHRYSALTATELESVLRGNGITTVVITGLMTQFCSVTTARHAHDLDYRVIFVSDANAGPDLPDLGWGAVSHDEARRVILTSLAAGVADIQTTAEVLEHLAPAST